MAGDNPNMPVGTAAISYLDASSQVHLRIYSTDGYNVIERRADPNTGWTTGNFAQPGEAVSATVWSIGGNAYIRVYCTSDDATTEWCSDADGAWYQGSFST